MPLEPSGPPPLGIDPIRARELFDEHLRDDKLRKHCLAAQAVMRALAKHFGQDENEWGMAGLLHDLDFEDHKEAERHGLKTRELLLRAGCNPETVEAIVMHNAEGLGGERKTFFEFALAAGETVTGLIIPTALVMPDKKLASVKAKSVVKRMKAKEFARNVSRPTIAECEKLGLDVVEFVELALTAMQEIADDLGL